MAGSVHDYTRRLRRDFDATGGRGTRRLEMLPARGCVDGLLESSRSPVPVALGLFMITVPIPLEHRDFVLQRYS